MRKERVREPAKVSYEGGRYGVSIVRALVWVLVRVQWCGR